MRFEIFDEVWFLVFGMPNVKYLTFDTPNDNAFIKKILKTIPNLNIIRFLKKKKKKKKKNTHTQNSLNIILFFILYESL